MDELTEAQWVLLAPLLPPQKPRGRKRADDQATLNGILFALRLCPIIPQPVGTTFLGILPSLLEVGVACPMVSMPRKDKCLLDATRGHASCAPHDCPPNDFPGKAMFGGRDLKTSTSMRTKSLAPLGVDPMGS
jgi:hypothetical protein